MGPRTEGGELRTQGSSSEDIRCIPARARKEPQRGGYAGERSTCRAASAEIIHASWCLGALGVTGTSDSELFVLRSVTAWLFWGAALKNGRYRVFHQLEPTPCVSSQTAIPAYFRFGLCYGFECAVLPS